jgi:hypothetical protein
MGFRGFQINRNGQKEKSLILRFWAVNAKRSEAQLLDGS